MTCRATFLGTGCPSRCVTTILDQDLSGVISVAGFVSRYGTVNVRILKPSIGRSVLGFDISGGGGVHFNLNTIGNINRTTIRGVVRRQEGGNPCGSVFSFIRHIGLATYGGGGVRSLTLTNTFSGFNVRQRRFFTRAKGKRVFLRALIHCNGGFRASGDATAGSLFKKSTFVTVTGPRVPGYRH